jgi:hypothetical protein
LPFEVGQDEAECHPTFFSRGPESILIPSKHNENYYETVIVAYR